MDAFSGQGVQVSGEKAGLGLAFTGAHLGDAALMQDDAADDLDGVVGGAQDPAGGLPAGGKSPGQDCIQRFSVGEHSLQVFRLTPELFVGHRLILFFQIQNALEDGLDALQLPLGVRTEYFFNESHCCLTIPFGVLISKLCRSLGDRFSVLGGISNYSLLYSFSRNYARRIL